jgi:membrane protease subunit HflK
MSWNSSGPGGSGGGSDGRGPWGVPPNNSGDGQGPGNRQQGPWGGGPRGGRGPGPSPDLDEIIARVQRFVRSFLPPGFGGGGPRGGGGGGGMLSGGRGILLVVLLVVAGWLASGFYRVEPDEMGVVLRFGRFDRTTLPGLNYHLPWPVESVLRPAVTRINRIDIGYRSPGSEVRQSGETGRELPEESLMLTGDENIIDINFAVFWRIRDAGAFLFNTRNPAYTVKSAAESVMREVIGRTPIQPALTTARALIEQDVMTGVQSILDQYGSGVEITQVQLQKVDPPAAVIESFRDVQRANTDAERMRNEAESYHNDIVPRARGDAARLIAEADASRQASIAEATGQAQRFLSVLKAYDAAKDITMQRLYIEAMQDILTHTPVVVVDDNLKGLLPLLQLNAPAGPAPVPARPAAPPPTPGAPAARSSTP